MRTEKTFYGAVLPPSQMVFFMPPHIIIFSDIYDDDFIDIGVELLLVTEYDTYNDSSQEFILSYQRSLQKNLTNQSDHIFFFRLISSSIAISTFALAEYW